MASATHLTIDDFEKLPQEQAENHELVDGELVEMSGNTLGNNEISDLLIEIMRPFARERHLGSVVSEQEYDFGGNVHGPDVSFFGPAKRALADKRKRVQRFVPDLAIEVVSENDTFNALVRKKDRYCSCGTSEVWIISPDSREVYMYTTTGDRILSGDAELTTDLLPGLRIPLTRLFA
jgi:Uma2 family endonuclease